MRKCFEFSAGVKGEMHEFSDVKAMFDLCDQRRLERKTGFLVRADSKSEAEQRLESLASIHQSPGTFYIL